MEEGFNYPAGTVLATNPPWSGTSGSAISIVAGSLTLTNLQPISPSGNQIQLGGGSISAYRNFSAAPITSVPGAAVYFSMLVNCSVVPTNRELVASLLESGSTSASSDTDPVGFSVTTGSGGYRLSVTSSGSDPATPSAVLNTNTTHFVVIKYTFGVSNGIASIFVDPVPGNPEPAFPSAQTGSGGDDGSSGVASDLQVILFRSPSSSSQGVVDFDTLRAGTNWADVTPLRIAVALTGPQDQAACSGEPAAFSVSATGLPPFTYQWRTNGIPIANATNTTYMLPAPNATDALNAYDVVVSSSFGSVTSGVAKLSVSYNPPIISVPPANQMIVPGVSNATFAVTVSADEPLSFQWRTNGVAISGATNASLTITNVGHADTSNLIDVVVANPCGVTTSTPPAAVYFPTIFLPVADAGAGFFSGENVIFTNASGIAYYAWSSSDPSVSLANWNLEGQLSELPLGTTGTSRYGINLNPTVSPEYYIFARTNTGPYTPMETVTCITTPDFVTFYISNEVVTVTPDGHLEFPGPPVITQDLNGASVLAGQNASLGISATGIGLSYQWFFAGNVINRAAAPVLNLTNVSAPNAGVYLVTVTNAFGSVTSSPAILTVVSPPSLSISSLAAGSIQWTVTTVTGLTYVVLAATNLSDQVWHPVLTNNTGNTGIINFQTNSVAGPSQYYRLMFP